MADLPVLGDAAACFFDLDGTLVEIAAHPSSVNVEPGLVDALAALARRLHGGIAIVSGRVIADVDRVLAPLLLPVAGVHGAQRRTADGRVLLAAVSGLAAAAEWLREWASSHPGSWLEEKPGALAMHYRGADHLADAVSTAMTQAQALVTGPGLRVLRGKKLVELTTASVHKGDAVRAFLDEAPFRGRKPWYFGDDVTDEDAFAVVRTLQGVGVKLGAGATLAEHRLAGPAALHEWLRCEAGLTSRGGA